MLLDLPRGRPGPAGGSQPGRRQPRPGPLAHALAQVTSAPSGAELGALEHAARSLRTLVAGGELDLNKVARQLLQAGRRVGLVDERVKRAIETGLS